jgi:hypothetical protein
MRGECYYEGDGCSDGESELPDMRTPPTVVAAFNTFGGRQY